MDKEKLISAMREAIAEKQTMWAGTDICITSEQTIETCAEAALKELGNEWVRVDSGVLPLYENEGKVKSPKVQMYANGCLAGWYFPDRFKTVEFEDWDDFNEADYPYMENDTEKGCVWLKAGWYELLYHPTDDYCYYEPVRPTHWQPLPSPPKDK